MDAEMTGTSGPSSPPNPTLPLSQDEQTILALYDQLQQLQIGISALKAQRSITTTRNQDTTVAEPTEAALSSLRTESLEARAKYELQVSVAQAVMTANPILEAVHCGREAGPIESDLRPHLQTRDTLSFNLSTQHTTLHETLDALSKAERDTLKATRKNLALAEGMLGVVADIERVTGEKLGGREGGREGGIDVDGVGDHESTLAELKSEMQLSRKKWAVMKATASAIVAGSGVDWVRDSEFRAVVLDPEDE